MGDIRHRRLVGSRVHYGIEFNEAKSGDFDVARTLIGKYVSSRLRDILRSNAA